MPTGEPAAAARQRGFTYLWLLFLIAVAGASAAALGQRWSTAVARDREAELAFRGHEIATAIASYRDAVPGAKLPRSLDDVVVDRRGPRVRHHLRRLYEDPMTGRADWTLLRDPEGGITGVRSSSPLPAFRTEGLRPSSRGAVIRVSDRLYAAPAPAIPASAASASAPP